MATYMLKWNPDKSRQAIAPYVADFRSGERELNWSCGNTRRIRLQDRIFMMRTGIAPRVIFASGECIGEPHEGRHYDRSRGRDTALFVGIRLDALEDPDSPQGTVLDTSNLPEGPLKRWCERTIHAVSSGIEVPPDAADELADRWASQQRAGSFPEEISGSVPRIEGAVRTIRVNAYERSPKAREECLRHHGYACVVCGFDFEATYGKKLGHRFIHVHHVVPLSSLRREYEVNPVEDLRPVCPNGHAMLHKANPVMTVDGLRECLREASRRKIPRLQPKA
jgi:5-methylcytosine-specific restriction protein A